MSSKTLRLVIPQWQGGANPYYAFGAELLAFIAPPSSSDTIVEIEVDNNYEKKLEEQDGIIEEVQQLEELDATAAVLSDEDPDKIIVFGGDCSISQAPFDFLSTKYGSDLGLIWLDAHPDISTKEISNHNHEFVLASILGLGENAFSKRMLSPIKIENVIYAGLVEDATSKLENLNLNIPVLTPENVKNELFKVEDWIRKRKIKKVCVHFDLDALSPDTFRSLTSSKPGQTKEEYGAAVGELNLDEIVTFLNTVNNKAEIVGLSIAEYMPWDAIYLREALSKLKIFQPEK